MKVLTNKDGDKIFVDGKYKGKSPLELFLSYKEYIFKIERNGRSVMQMENIQPGSDDVIMINFEDEKYDNVADDMKKTAVVKNKKWLIGKTTKTAFGFWLRTYGGLTCEWFG